MSEEKHDRNKRKHHTKISEAFAEPLDIHQYITPENGHPKNMKEAITGRLNIPWTDSPAIVKSPVYNIQNNYEGSNAKATNVICSAYQCTFHTMDKWLEAFEQNKKLYEALIKEKEEKIALQQRLIEQLDQNFQN